MTVMASAEPCSERSKLVWIIAESGTEEPVMELLAELGLEHYTRFQQIEGSGETGHKQGNAIFPGINMVIMIAMDEDLVEPLVMRLHEIRDAFIVRPGMRVIVTDCVMY